MKRFESYFSCCMSLLNADMSLFDVVVRSEFDEESLLVTFLLLM